LPDLSFDQLMKTLVFSVSCALSAMPEQYQSDQSLRVPDQHWNDEQRQVQGSNDDHGDYQERRDPSAG
jgi:hypothetical protein